MSDISLSSTLFLPPIATAKPRTSVLQSQWLAAAMGMGIGLIAFFILGFNHVLPPSRVDWLLRPSLKTPYYDPSTEYLGWDYFRRSPWQFPLGLNRDYGIEFGGSIVYSDSIPFLAILFKLFSPWMGRDFQYIGIWILLCFMMQGMFGALLASIFVSRIELKLIIAAFFALSPILLERGWDQYTLLGQWLILWALYLYFIPRQTQIRWVWMLIAVLAVTTGFYFVPIILMLWAADAIKTLIERKKSIGSLSLEGIGMIATVLLAMWTVGYFTFSIRDAGTEGFGEYALNVLGPIDSWGHSPFLTAQNHGPHYRAEGYAYFGFGMILLSSMALFALLRDPLTRQQCFFVLPLAIVCLGLTAFALSNQVALGSHELSYPNIWFHLGWIFRSSGRMFWPAYYAIWLGIFYLTTRRLNDWIACILLSAIFAVQFIDNSSQYAGMRLKFGNLTPWHSPLTSPFWTDAVQKYKQIVVVPSGAAYPYVPVAYLAANHNLPTNGVYLARNRWDKEIGPISDRRLNALRANQPNLQTLYIIPEPDRFASLIKSLEKVHGVGVIDGYNIIAPNWFANTPATADGLTPAGGN